MANEMQRLHDLDDNDLAEMDNGELAFSDDMENGYAEFHMDNDFSVEMSGLSVENSVDFSEDSMDISMHQNGGMESFDEDDISDISSDYYSNGYDLYQNYYSSNEYYSDDDYMEADSLYSSNVGSYSEAQFSEDVHEKIAAQERAEEEDWNDFAEHNTFAPPEVRRKPHYNYD